MNFAFSFLFDIRVYLTEFTAIKKFLRNCGGEEGEKVLKFLPNTCERIFVD